MTLGPKFFFCNKMITAPRRKHLNPYFLAESAAFYLYFLIPVSDHDLKPSATFFRKKCMRPWIRRLRFRGFLPLEGDFGHGALRRNIKNTLKTH